MCALWLSACAPRTKPESATVLHDTEHFTELHRTLILAQSKGGDPDELHAWLSLALTGDLLTETFLRARASQRRQHARQERITINNISYRHVEVTTTRDRTATVRAIWTVDGSVNHALHQHDRALQQESEYTLTATASGPRISAERPVDSVRLSAPPPRNGLPATKLIDLIPANTP